MNVRALERLPREGVLYELSSDFTVERREALRRQIHRDLRCACMGAIDTCEALLEGRAAVAGDRDIPAAAAAIEAASSGVAGAKASAGRGSRPSKAPATSRGGAAAARRAHNPKVEGSSPSPATRTTRGAA